MPLSFMLDAFAYLEVGVALSLVELNYMRVSFLPVPSIYELTSIDDAIDTSPKRRLEESILFERLWSFNSHRA